MEIGFYGDLDIIYQVYHECENCYSYKLGRMVNGKFEAFICWTHNDDILDGI